MNLLTRKLVAKELHLHRWLIAGTVAAGIAGVLMSAGGELGFNVGFLVWLTAIIALGVLIAIFGVAGERKERALPFVLSLPLDPATYVRAKLLGLLLCFLLAWAPLCAAAVALVVAMPGIADGLLPFAVLLCGYLLLNFSLVLSGALHIRSEGGMVAVVVLTNMSVSLFMMGIGRIPEVGRYMAGPVPVWNAMFWELLGAELVLTLGVLSLPLFIAARRRDFL
ncbi:ABC transporter permease [Pelomonas cellulosilytica]|uniref:ABC transporter permease n=1 Tax=Pelomonas cellulosilytica TaxID=2906762 RepID=A0ABS8XTV3_9BURK|nr:ABC transporter permease [Pelomonas sp. P8]MCE4554114.1 ABC transporter permease [Pelomonas sp. P8]